jgi:G8 domain
MFFLAVRRCCLSAVLFSIATIIHIVAMALLAAVVVGGFCQVAGAATPMVCTTGALPHGSKASPPDLVVTTGTCIVGLGTYYFHNINIFGGGKLQFADALTDFWAESILVQNNGSLTAGTTGAPIGTAGGHVTIHLWGPDQGGTATGPSGSGGKGIECLMSNGSGGYVTDPTCGVPSNIWSSNVMNMSNMNPASCTKVSQLGKDLLLPGKVDDCFYQYEPIVYDDGDPNAYFGYKVLALSYGGTINLFGKKGASYPAAVPLPAWYTGTSWVRLAQNIDSNSQVSPLLVVDRPVDWMAGDQIVVTSTDYLPGHSEQMTIQSVDSDRITIHVTRAFRFPHNGTKVDLAAKGVPADVGPQDDPNLPKGNGRLATDDWLTRGPQWRCCRAASASSPAATAPDRIFPQPA